MYGLNVSYPRTGGAIRNVADGRISRPKRSRWHLSRNARLGLGMDIEGRNASRHYRICPAQGRMSPKGVVRTIQVSVHECGIAAEWSPGYVSRTA